MNKREIFQLVGNSLCMHLIELFDYYPEENQKSIRKMVKGLVLCGQIRCVSLESNGLYITPEGLEAYVRRLI